MAFCSEAQLKAEQESFNEEVAKRKEVEEQIANVEEAIEMAESFVGDEDFVRVDFL